MSHITKAASVLLARQSDDAEVFVVRRAEKLRFLGGFYAFPGGKVSPDDLTIAAANGPPEHSVDEKPDDRCATAARELFEETGVLVARRPDGTFPASGTVLHYLRRKLVAEEVCVFDHGSGVASSKLLAKSGSQSLCKHQKVIHASSFRVFRLPAFSRARRNGGVGRTAPSARFNRSGS